MLGGRADGCILGAELLIAGLDVDIGVDNVVGFDDTFESKCPICLRVADGCINNDVGVTRCFRKPNVRVLNRTTVWRLDERREGFRAQTNRRRSPGA